MIDLKFKVNGNKIKIKVDILRDKLDLTGTKEGCGIGECGACTIIMNGEAVNSCLILADQVQDAEIETVEILEKDEVLSNLQKAFHDYGAIQCGFCTPGMLMSAKALLDKNPKPSGDEIKIALEGNLCRCTGYIPIIEAITNAE